MDCAALPAPIARANHHDTLSSGFRHLVTPLQDLDKTEGKTNTYKQNKLKAGPYHII